MTDISPLRLFLMRLMYLVIALGAGSMIWPLILQAGSSASHMAGVAWALLGTIALLCWLGIRQPTRMLPILLFELTWKVIWLAFFAFPSWRDGTLSPAMRTSVFETSVGLILLFVIPWSHVWKTYVAARGEPWFRRRGSDARRAAPVH